LRQFRLELELFFAAALTTDVTGLTAPIAAR